MQVASSPRGSSAPRFPPRRASRIPCRRSARARSRRITAWHRRRRIPRQHVGRVGGDGAARRHRSAGWALGCRIDPGVVRRGGMDLSAAAATRPQGTRAGERTRRTHRVPFGGCSRRPCGLVAWSRDRGLCLCRADSSEASVAADDRDLRSRGGVPRAPLPGLRRRWDRRLGASPAAPRHRSVEVWP